MESTEGHLVCVWIRVTVRVTTPKCGPQVMEIAVNKAVIMMMMMTRCHLTPHRTYG